MLDLRHEHPNGRDDHIVHPIRWDPTTSGQRADPLGRRREQERQWSHHSGIGFTEQFRSQHEETLRRGLCLGVAFDPRALGGGREHQLHEVSVPLGEADVGPDVRGEPQLKVSGPAGDLQVTPQLVEAVSGDGIEDGVPITEVTQGRGVTHPDTACEFSHSDRLLPFRD